VERNSPEAKKYRRRFCRELLALNIERLVFVDESFCKTGMRREYGWAPRGARSPGERPGRSWKTISLVGAIRLGDRPRLMTHEGSVNGRTFMRFVTKYLVPWLREGDVVFLDNLNIHRMVRVRRAIEEAGAFAVYLPTYSPELNPIELWWGDVKRELRRLGIDAQPELRRAAQRLRSKLELRKIAGWFRHALAEAQLK
jgi:transposase